MVLTTVLMNDNRSTTTEDLRFRFARLINSTADYSIVDERVLTTKMKNSLLVSCNAFGKKVHNYLKGRNLSVKKFSLKRF